MRLTDDYLLITTKENNALVFIEKLMAVSNENGFKFNMKKLKTNYPLNLNRFTGILDNVHEQNISEQFCDWIGISIDMNTLALMPKLNMKISGILCTLNVNFQTKKSMMWLKKKLKSFLMNNICHYFRATINNSEFANKTLQKLYIIAAFKLMSCIQELKDYFRFDKKMMAVIDIKIASCIYSVIRSLFKYLVCNVDDPIFQ